MRKYFSGLFGNDAHKSRLGAKVESGTLPHAFLVVGADGSGKKTFALELAAALNCENKGDKLSPLPCHKCNTCKRIFEGNYTDISTLKRQSGKATIGVEEVRLFREDMYLSPTESLYKIYVIEEAEKLTVNAQNALLTVLEEPPKNVIILLLAESGDKILTTVKSRTQAVAMQRFDSAVMRSYLTAHNEKAALYEKIDPKALEGIIMSADGRIGAALSLLSDKEAKENKKSRDATQKIVSALESGTPYEHLHSAIIDLPTSRVEFCEAIEELMSAVRDVMLLKLDQNLPLTFYTSRDDAARAGEKMSVKRLMSIYELLRDAYEDASKNVGIAATAAKLGARIKLI